ncbi:hypothetical protein GIHI108528_00075 [Gillisia hiemivivida]
MDTVSLEELELKSIDWLQNFMKWNSNTFFADSKTLK